MIKARTKSAFTLIEISIAAAAISILVVIISQFFTSNLKNYQINQLKLEMTDQQINAFSRLTPEIKAATSVELCDKNQLTFYYYKGAIDSPAQKISYGLDQNQQQISKSTIQPAVDQLGGITYPADQSVDQVVSTYVTNSDSTPVFSYFDSTGAALATPCDVTKVRLVQIDLRNQAIGRYASREVESKTRVDIRNLKDNL